MGGGAVLDQKRAGRNEQLAQGETIKRPERENRDRLGGKAQPDGTSIQFYLVGIRQPPRSDIDYQPYMFTLDRDGKIAKVQ